MELPTSFLRKQESRSHILWIPYQARNDILYSDYGDTTLGSSVLGLWPDWCLTRCSQVGIVGFEQQSEMDAGQLSYWLCVDELKEGN